MKRRIISLMIAMLLILGMPLQALAATHDAEDFAGVQNVFATDTDAEVVVNLKQDITWESISSLSTNQSTWWWFVVSVLTIAVAQLP